MTNYDKSMLIFFYLILCLIIIIDILRNINKEHRISLLSYTKAYYFLIYGVIPIISIYYIGNETYGNVNYYTTESKYFYILLLLTWITYIMIAIAGRFLKKIMDNGKQKGKYYINILSKNFIIINYILAIIGFIALMMWTKAYGMPWDIIKYANAARSGRSPIYNPYTFFKPLCYFSIIAFYNFLLLIIKGKKNIYIVVGMILSLFFSIVLLFANDGRMLMIIFVLALIMSYYNKKIEKVSIKLLIKVSIISIATIIALGNLDNFTYFLRNGQIKESDNNAGVINVLYKEFSYTHKNGVNALYFKDQNRIEKSTELQDIINIFVAWIPDRIKKNNFQNLYEYNSQFYPESTGEVPTDFITSSIFKFGYFGVIILPVVVVLLIYYIERIISKQTSSYINVLYNLIGTYYGLRIVAYYDLSTMIFSSLYIIVSYILIGCFCQKKLPKEMNIDNENYIDYNTQNIEIIKRKDYGIMR